MSNLKYFILIFLMWSAVLINPDGFLYEDDEGAYLYISSVVSNGKTLYSDVLASKPPLIFYLGSIIYKISGNNIIAFRYIASLLGLLTSILIFLIIHKTGSPSVAFICSVLFLSDPLIFTQMRLFRTDIFALFFITAALFFIIWRKNISDIVYVALFSSLAILSRDDAFLYTTFILIFFSIRDRDKRFLSVILIIVAVFLISTYMRGKGQVIGSFSQQIDPLGFDFKKRQSPFAILSCI